MTQPGCRAAQIRAATAPGRPESTERSRPPTRSASRSRPFFTEDNGTWRAAGEVATALNIGGNAAVESVSCPSAGNCAEAGSYLDQSRHTQVFVVGELNGHWRNAQEIPGTAALNRGGSATVGALSCVPAGHYCSAGGYYLQTRSIQQAFVVNKS